ncbi:hypothetical protein [Longimicrobium terrae]|uniref:Uncharacterized protein n=1 Tax=Longimicrobium terrae TaxID=1639882 RepID=A0A841H3I7_9BACT|nr:hypothetical protein [Longimicrobium terrae]MBB4638017.1 hypothetical protein [Longimicrobium terrae]MBB6072389.1 hypothetical protein [Longimicrobium terrae]NNC32197.1 hypothetical protein [Longimicrobium terrae]
MRSLLRTLILSAAALSIAAPADAQLGGLARRAAARAAGNAAGQAVGLPSSNGARAPEFNDETLEITPQVVTRFIAALDAEASQRQRLAGERAAAGSLRAEVERYERCTSRADENRQQSEAAAASENLGLAVRISQALLRGDTTTYRRLTDSMVVAQGAAADYTAACGQRPNAAYQAISRLDNAGDLVAGAAADAGQFTIRQFAVLRERIAPWVLSHGRQGGFTAEERRALEGATGLAGREEQLRS